MSENAKLVFWMALVIWNLYYVLKHEFYGK